MTFAFACFFEVSKLSSGARALNSRILRKEEKLWRNMT
jgi:hypothetical protein